MSISKRFWIYVFIVSLAVLIVTGIGNQHVFAQTTNARYFPETGHWVTDEFLTKYDAAKNPAEVYGAPITEQFKDSISGLQVQYFEKARFELHPDAPAGLRVQLTQLGTYLYNKGQVLNTSTNTQACKTFVETGHAVCYAFLNYFTANGGVAQFGYPISGFEIHDGWIVQYFQNARFEWHPENAVGKRVTVSNLGYRYFYILREDPTRLNPVLNDEAPKTSISSLELHAFAKSAIVPLDGNQTLYIIVRDQYHNPVEGVSVDFTVIFPDGTRKDYKPSPTNSYGVSTLSFDVHTTQPGIATVTVSANYQHGILTENTRTSFALWW